MLTVPQPIRVIVVVIVAVVSVVVLVVLVVVVHVVVTVVFRCEAILISLKMIDGLTD